MKKVLTRIDAANYVTKLEEEVVALKGEDFLADMRSDGNYAHNAMFS